MRCDRLERTTGEDFRVFSDQNVEAVVDAVWRGAGSLCLFLLGVFVQCSGGSVGGGENAISRRLAWLFGSPLTPFSHFEKNKGLASFWDFVQELSVHGDEISEAHFVWGWIAQQYGPELDSA